PRETSPAPSSTLRCLEIAGWLMSKGSASSLTEASPDARRDRIARRVGSERAAKIASSCGEDRVACCITDWLYNASVESRQGAKKERPEPVPGARPSGVLLGLE